MVEITNEISKKFINDKVAELVDFNLPVTSLKNIDRFLNDGIDLIAENLTEKLKQHRATLIINIEKQLTDNMTTISKLNGQIKDYEEDLEALEKLKAFKRKSKFLK